MRLVHSLPDEQRHDAVQNCSDWRHGHLSHFWHDRLHAQPAVGRGARGLTCAAAMAAVRREQSPAQVHVSAQAAPNRAQAHTADAEQSAL